MKSLRISPERYSGRNMFDAFDILHGVEDGAPSPWAEYDIVARKGQRLLAEQAAIQAKESVSAADLQKLIELARKLPTR